MPNTNQPQPASKPGTTIISTPSAAQSAALTEEQKKKRYQELRQRLGRPRLEVIGVPGRHYFWAHRSDTNEMDRLDLVGYTLTREPNAAEVLSGKAKPKVQAGGLREDGTYIQGDVILMDCDLEVYEFMMLENEERASGMISSAKDNFVIEQERRGVPTFEVDKSKVGGH
jgi:hypothetical protein